MKLENHIKEGLLNLMTSKLRSVLALLGILVGTASVVAMVSGGELATNEALKQFKILGTDLLAVTISDMPEKIQGESVEQYLTLEQAKNLLYANNDIQNVAPYTQLFNAIQFEGHELSGGILGVTEQFANIVHIDLSRGRFISSLDRYAMFCVVGHSIAEYIKKITFKDVIGQQLQIGNSIFTIIGVAKSWPENSFVYASIDQSIMVPILTATTMSKYARINNIILRLTPTANIGKVQQGIKRYINPYLANKRLFFRSAKELIARMAMQSYIFTVFLGLIGSISLIVGGIGVMNIMLVSVVERRREIGIRLAVGATRKDIRTLFLLEATMLSLMGGFLGVIIGVSIAYAMAFFWHWEFIFFLLPPVIGFSVSVFIGVFFGFYPAYKAAQLDPIAALRAE